MISNVERRNAARVQVRMESFVLTGNKSYVGFIENVSNNGIEFTFQILQKDPDDIYRDKRVSIVFQVPSGEALNLSCKVMRTSGGWPVSTSVTLGLQVTKYSSQFEQLMETLEIVTVN